MAANAGVWGTDLGGQVRPGNTKAVIPPRIDLHEILVGHMTADTLRAFCPFRVVMMRRIVVLGLFQARKIIVSGWTVALGAGRIAGCHLFTTVGIVTVCAGHTLCVHLALQKGTVDINLVVYLAIGVIQSVPKQGQFITVRKIRAHMGAV